MSIILFILSGLFFIASVFQFLEKGIPLNNEYIWASDKERDNMSAEHKKPYFQQSAVVFLLCGICLLTYAFSILLKLDLLVYIGYILVFITITYAVASSITIAKKQKTKGR